MLKFLTGAAAFALVASAVTAEPGGAKGGGHNAGGGGKDHASRGGGGEGEKPHGDRGSHPHAAAERDDKPWGGGGDDGKVSAMPGHGGSRHARTLDGRGGERTSRPEHDSDRAATEPSARKGRGASGGNSGGGRDAARERGHQTVWHWADAVPERTRGLIAGCPPGLAKKGAGCLPPGAARGAATPLFYDSPRWWDFNDRWHDSSNWNEGSYRYYDGYLVRYGDGGIDSWLPLLGGALSPGNLWPSQYETQGVPTYYQDYYSLGSPDGYRYYDDTLYRVDPQSQAITGIAGLLTGDRFQVGQPMPAGYDVYNVPYTYRDRYRDGPEADYRYSDGSIYRIDPTTQLIQAVIELIT